MIELGIVREEMIAIKTCLSEDNFAYFKEGEIYEVSYHCLYGGFVVHSTLERNGQILPSIKGEFLGNYDEYFMRLSEYREQQIKTVLDD